MNKFDEKFQFFVFIDEKKFKIFDLHREFLKNFKFDDKIKNVVTIKMTKIIIFRDLTNRKSTKLLKMFFFSIFKKHFFSLKKMYSIFLNIYNELCAEHEIFKKNKIKRLHKYCNFIVFLFIQNIVIENDVK